MLAKKSIQRQSYYFTSGCDSGPAGEGSGVGAGVTSEEEEEEEEEEEGVVRSFKIKYTIAPPIRADIKCESIALPPTRELQSFSYSGTL